MVEATVRVVLTSEVPATVKIPKSSAACTTDVAPDTPSDLRRDILANTLFKATKRVDSIGLDPAALAAPPNTANPSLEVPDSVELNSKASIASLQFAQKLEA